MLYHIRSIIKTTTSSGLFNIINRIIQVSEPELNIDSPSIQLEKSASYVYSWDEESVQCFWSGNLRAQQEITLTAGILRVSGLNQHYYRQYQPYETTFKCPQW